jgi:hypothetical protein
MRVLFQNHVDKYGPGEQFVFAYCRQALRIGRQEEIWVPGENPCGAEATVIAYGENDLPPGKSGATLTPILVGTVQNRVSSKGCADVLGSMLLELRLYVYCK